MEGGLRNVCINALRKSDDVVNEMAAFKKSIHELEDYLRESGRYLKVTYKLPDKEIAVDDVLCEEFPFSIEGDKPNIDDPVYVTSHLIWSHERTYSRRQALYEDRVRWSVQFSVEGCLDREGRRVFFSYRKRSFDFKFEDLCEIYRYFPRFVEKMSNDLIECYERYNKDKHD